MASVRPAFLLLVAAVASCAAERVRVCQVADEPFTMLSRDGLVAASNINNREVFEPGQLVGASSDFVNKIMTELGWDYEVMVFKSYAEAAYNTRIGNCSFAWAPFTYTTFRQQCDNCPELEGTNFGASQCCLDFGHPHYSGTTISVLRPNEVSSSYKFFFSLIVDKTMVNTYCSMMLCIILSAHVIWFFERKNPEFAGGYTAGMISGLWWSAVTMTTVGYGDKAPQSRLGRVFTFFYMFIGIVMTGIFAAEATSQMTERELTLVLPREVNMDELGTMRVCTIQLYKSILPEGTRTTIEEEDTLPRCIAHLKAGEVDAVFYDELALKYYVKVHPGQDVTVVSNLKPILLGPLFAKNSTYANTINTEIIRALADTTWLEVVLAHWFGVDLFGTELVSSGSTPDEEEYYWQLGIPLALYTAALVILWAYRLLMLFKEPEAAKKERLESQLNQEVVAVEEQLTQLRDHLRGLGNAARNVALLKRISTAQAIPTEPPGMERDKIANAKANASTNANAQKQAPEARTGAEEAAGKEEERKERRARKRHSRGELDGREGKNESDAERRARREKRRERREKKERAQSKSSLENNQL